MKKQLIAFCLILVCFLVSVKTVFGAPLINEFYSPSSDDWIEIYNPDPETIDLGAFRIRDSTENNKLDLSGNIPPLGFAVFEWSNKLNNSGDIIKLILISDNSSIDQITYGNQGGLIAPDVSQSAGRSSDGASNWTIFTAPSKNSSNNSSPAFVPPSPTPTKHPHL